MRDSSFVCVSLKRFPPEEPGAVRVMHNEVHSLLQRHSLFTQRSSIQQLLRQRLSKLEVRGLRAILLTFHLAHTCVDKVMAARGQTARLGACVASSRLTHSSVLTGHLAATPVPPAAHLTVRLLPHLVHRAPSHLTIVIESKVFFTVFFSSVISDRILRLVSKVTVAGGATLRSRRSACFY